MEKTLAFNNEDIKNSMTIKLTDIPKDIPPFTKNIRRAPRREAKLSNSRDMAKRVIHFLIKTIHL